MSLPAGYEHISFRLEMSFSTFGKAKLAAFIKDVANLGGCEVADILLKEKYRGCVIVHLNVPRKIAKLIQELYIASLKEKDDPEYSSAMEEFSKKWKLTDFTKYDSEMNIVVKRKPFKHAMVFIHGWNGGEETFGIIPNHFFKNYPCAVHAYQYPTSLFGHSPSIILIADALHSDIETRFPEHKLAIIAHSQGGIIARKFVVAASERDTRLDMHVKNIVFAASPHDGATLAGIGNKLPFMRSHQLSENSPNSPVLYDLNGRWMKWVQKHVPHTCHIKSLIGSEDEVVSLNSARGSDPDAVPILGKGHINIVKPDSAKDQVVTVIKNFLERTDFWNPHTSTQIATNEVSGNYVSKD